MSRAVFSARPGERALGRKRKPWEHGLICASVCAHDSSQHYCETFAVCGRRNGRFLGLPRDSIVLQKMSPKELSRLHKVINDARTSGNAQSRAEAVRGVLSEFEGNQRWENANPGQLWDSNKYPGLGKTDRKQSGLVFAQQEAQRGLAGAIGLRGGLEIGFRMLDRAGSAGPINFPAPGLGRASPVLDDDGKITVLDHESIIAENYGLVRIL